MRLSASFFTIIISLILAGCEQDASITSGNGVHKKLISSKKVIIKHAFVHDTICIAAVGDIMLGSSYPDSSKLPPDRARGSFMPAIKYLEGADVIFGNLEGALLDTGMPATGKKKMSSAYLFRMPTQYGKVLKDAGFNLLSIANNHITDFAQRGCNSTVKTLDANEINYAGLDTYPQVIFIRNGIKYGFCSFAPNAHTLPLLDLIGAGRIIHDLKQQCDILIVSFHGGGEGASHQHVPLKMELYLNERRGDVHAFAHTAIDSGADIVLGNGPHVSRAMEKYKGRLIAYSLGNFCTYKNVSINGVCGIAPLLKVYLNKKGEFINGNIISFRQTRQKGLELDTLNGAVKRIQLLTQIDFPESGLNIDNDGSITVED